MLCIRNQTGQVLGVYRADHPRAALEALAQEHQYMSFASWAAHEGVAEDAFEVSDADQALIHQGRQLYGPTYRGYVWYDTAQNAGLLAQSGESGRYEPHPEACSPPYRTEAQAALHALQV